jgi:hypothetical protein
VKFAANFVAGDRNPVDVAGDREEVGLTGGRKMVGSIGNDWTVSTERDAVRRSILA